MGCITSENVSFWQDLANRASAQRPSVGKTVQVDKGRKHKGKIGQVIRHQIDKFQDAYRYGNEASHHMRDITGRYGWCCLIQCNDGTTFWVKADYLTCIQTNNTPCQK